MSNVSLGVLAYDEPARFNERLLSVIGKTLRSWYSRHGVKAELLVINNAPQPHDAQLHQALHDLRPQADVFYLRTGRNEQYSRGLNLMAGLANHPVLVFLCLKHCRLYDATWLDDVVAAFATPRVVLAGTLAPTNYVYTPDLGTGMSQHVQGGCFGVSVPWLRANPYDAGHYPQKYSDIYISTRAMQTGYKMAEVPSVRSVWAAKVPEPPPPGVKIVHDHS